MVSVDEADALLVGLDGNVVSGHCDSEYRKGVSCRGHDVGIFCHLLSRVLQT